MITFMLKLIMIKSQTQTFKTFSQNCEITVPYLIIQILFGILYRGLFFFQNTIDNESTRSVTVISLWIQEKISEEFWKKISQASIFQQINS
jgi:hypothetical protein